RSPMMPEPMTAARSRAVPTASAVTRCAIVKCCVSVADTRDLHPERYTRDSASTLHGRWRVNKARALFLCTHNSARSQMAEGFLRARAGDRLEVQSAGTEATSVNPLAIRVMAERGIDITHTSKLYAGLLSETWDYLITVCDDANEQCPFVPG